jgi:hypothetical protein
MRIAAEIDISQFKKAMDKAKFTSQEVTDVLTAGAVVVHSAQFRTVAHDTYDTRNSIDIQPDPSDKAALLIGPHTTYAPYIEYGTSNPNYPIQPFVVPSATGQNKASVIKACLNAVIATLKGKGLL